MLCPTTCVGLGYGRTGPSRRGFSRRLRITLLPRPEGRVTVAPHPRHLRQPPGFAWAAGRALGRAEPSGPRGHHCASPLLIRLPTCAEGPQTPAAPPPPPPPPPAPPAPAAPAVPAGLSTETVAVIAAAVTACGYSAEQIHAIRPAEQPAWRNFGRASGMRTAR